MIETIDKDEQKGLNKIDYSSTELRVTAKIKKTLELMRDTKYTERKCFHTGVVPELIKQCIKMPS